MIKTKSKNIIIHILSIILGLYISTIHAHNSNSSLPLINLTTIKQVPIYYVTTNSIPSIDIMIMLPNIIMPTSNSCISDIATNLIGKKFNKISEEKTLSTLQDSGAEFEINKTEDYFSIRLRSLNSEAINSFNWLYQAIYNSDINVDIFLREQKNHIQNLQEQNKQPSIVAAQNLKHQVYGDTHIYAQKCTPEQAKQVKLQDIKNFYTNQIIDMPLNKAKILIVGDINLPAINTLLNSTLLKEKQYHNIAPLIYSDNKSNYIKTYNTKNIKENLPSQYTAYLDIVQANVKMGLPFIKRNNLDNADIFNLLVANYILGSGNFNCRLMQQVREKYGFVYGISSSFLPLSQAGIFSLEFQTKKQQLEQVNNLVIEILTDFINHGVKPEEVEEAKNFLLQSFSSRLDSNQKWLMQLAIIAWYDLPLNYVQTWEKNINLTNVNSINKAVKNNFDLKQLKISIVTNKT